MPLPFAEPPSSLCVLRLSAIGDTCHTVPVVRAIQDAWPGTKLTWIVGKTEQSLLAGLEGVEFVVLDKGLGWRGYAAVHRALGGRKFDALLHMHASTRANIVSTLVRSPLRIGFDRARARDQQWLFTNTKLPARPQRHVMDGLFEFAELIGVPRPAQPRWDIPVGAAEITAIAPLFKKDTRTLVISPCTGQRFRNYRNWRADWYAQVADYAAPRSRRQHRDRADLRPRDRGRSAVSGQQPDRQDVAEAAARDPAARERRALPRLGPGAHGDGRRHARRRPLCDLEPPPHGALLQPAPRRRQVPRGRGQGIRPADRDAALGTAGPRPIGHESDYGGRCRR